MRYLAMVALALFAFMAFARPDDEEKVPLDKLPKAVVEAVKKRFPKAELVSASKEDEDGKIVYELQIKDGGTKLDVTVTLEGVITTIEKEIKAGDLPKPVAEALEKKYPKATYKIVEEIIKVKDGKDQPAYYEALLETADKKTFEVEVAADGKILNTEEKKEEKKPEKIAFDKVPKPVQDAVMARFPKAEVTSVEKETENGKVIYDIELKHNGRKYEMDILEDGTILEIEKEIPLKDVPDAVTKAIAAKYPKSTIKEVMEVNKVKGKDETPDHYEVTIETADKKTIELAVSLDGKTIKEEGGEQKDEKKKEGAFSDDFTADKTDLTHTGTNPYFILEPGYQLVLADDKERIVITVLAETKMVDGVECRIVEERETKGDKLVEVSRNYFAISKRTNNVYYFGEDVDIYKDGKVTSHEGAWLSGKDGARFGLMMPGLPLLGSRFYQEVAPKTAMDRAEIVSVGLTAKTPAGEFKNCIKIEETTPLEKGTKEYKLYAPGVGLINDGDLRLVKYGKVELPKK
jgi:uncharacterized membrane protein YkoI